MNSKNLKAPRSRLSLQIVAPLAILLGSAAYSATRLCGSHGLVNLLKTRSEIMKVENANVKLAQEIALKKNYIQRLQTDPATQALELERAGFTFPGATVFKIGHRNFREIPPTTQSPNAK